MSSETTSHEMLFGLGDELNGDVSAALSDDNQVNARQMHSNSSFGGCPELDATFTDVDGEISSILCPEGVEAGLWLDLSDAFMDSDGEISPILPAEDFSSDLGSPDELNDAFIGFDGDIEHLLGPAAEVEPPSGHVCAICLGEGGDTAYCDFHKDEVESWICLPCGHIYHEDCLRDLILSTGSCICPLCRFDCE